MSILGIFIRWVWLGSVKLFFFFFLPISARSYLYNRYPNSLSSQSPPPLLSPAPSPFPPPPLHHSLSSHPLILLLKFPKPIHFLSFICFFLFPTLPPPFPYLSTPKPKNPKIPTPNPPRQQPTQFFPQPKKKNKKLVYESFFPLPKDLYGTWETWETSRKNCFFCIGRYLHILNGTPTSLFPIGGKKKEKEKKGERK